jgi:hypothetical protein
MCDNADKILGSNDWKYIVQDLAEEKNCSAAAWLQNAVTPPSTANE